jgi:hypothetical protein
LGSWTDIPNRRDWRCARKGCWGLNAQGICDDNLIFTFFALNCAGGTHDSTACRLLLSSPRLVLLLSSSSSSLLYIEHE